MEKKNQTTLPTQLKIKAAIHIPKIKREVLQFHGGNLYKQGGKIYIGF